MKNIVLFGFMGTGKSAVARELARRLNLPVVEMDRKIEEGEGMTIGRIFQEKGEDHFRACERRLVKELAAGSGKIIATGGGVVLNPDNIRELGRHGFLVCLAARPEVILKRVEKERHRPLLEAGERPETIAGMIKKRRRFYGLILDRIDTSELSVPQVADRVLELISLSGISKPATKAPRH